MGLTLKVNCTDCGHERIVDGIDTGGLPLDDLIIDTHACECTKKCEECEDLERLQTDEVDLTQEVKQLKCLFLSLMKEVPRVGPGEGGTSQC